MIAQQDLVQQLARRASGAWSVVERIEDAAFAADPPAARQRRDHHVRLSVIVHQDTPRGRGSARVDLAAGSTGGAGDASAADVVDQAIAAALAAVGPAWASSSPAAPAKVDLVDPGLVEHELGAIALGMLSQLHRPDGVTVTAAAEVRREKVTIVAGSGFHASWLATALRGEALVATADHSLLVSRHARRGDDFDFDAAIASAAADLAVLASAGPPVPGPCALWLGPDAIVPATGSFRTRAAGGIAVVDEAGSSGSTGSGSTGFGSTGFGSTGFGSTGSGSAAGSGSTSGLAHGLWSIFALQADAAVERQGLTRYRLGAELAPGASQLSEPLGIASNGALDFAALSVPVTDEAVAIRSFPLVERGIAVGLGLSAREAALRRTDPNGGVRNLVVSRGTWLPAPPLTAPPTGRTIEIRRLHSVAIDPHTGHATLDIALGFDHRPDRASPSPFTGGTIHLDLLSALALAQRSSQPLRRGGYLGPADVLIAAAELLA